MLTVEVIKISASLQETLHNHKHESADEADALENGSSEYVANKITKKHEAESLLRNWPLMSSIIIYCIFSLQDVAYQEVSLQL